MIRTSLFIFFISIGYLLNGQLLVGPNGSGDTLAHAIMGPSATISNIYFRCNPGASGFALGTNSNLPLDTSVILSNGLITSAMGPNINTATSDVFPPPQDGDTLLSGFIPDTIPTEDACVLQFKYIPKVSPLSVRYVFASEEYPEYVCCPTADRFGLFIVGPNPTNMGPPNYFYDDFAVIPNSNPPMPTLLNTVNPGQMGSAPCANPAGCISLSNSMYYHDNSNSMTEEFDGYTDALQGEVPVYPCSTYTVRFAIADGGDATVNSYLFIETSSQNDKPYTMELKSNISAPYVIEGCLGGTLTISMANDNPFDLVLLLEHYGNAINGVDYSLPDTAIIPAGATSVTLPFTPFLDGLVENDDTIRIAVRLPCTGWLDSVKIAIKDSLTLEVSPTQVICPGDTVQLLANTPGSVLWEPTYNISNPVVENPLVYPAVDTVYTVTATLLACQSTSTVEVQVREAPFVDAGRDTGACAGQFLYLDASVGPNVIVHFWSPPNGLGNITQLDPMLIPDQSRYYTLWVRDIFGCVNTDSVYIEVYPYPNVDAGPNKTICFGDTVQLDGSGNGSFEWNPKSFILDYTAEDPLVFPDSTTTFQLYLTDSNGCRSGDQVKVRVRNLPPVDAGPDLLLCENDTAFLSASGAQSYNWASNPFLLENSGAQVRAVPSTGSDFIVTGVDQFGCENRDTVHVDIIPAAPVQALASSQSICPGDTILLEASGKGVAFHWSGPGLIFQPDSAKTRVVLQSNAQFLVRMTDSNGCRSYDSINIQVNEIPKINTGLRDSICLGDSIQLSAGGGVSYHWMPSSSLDDPFSPTPLAFPLSNTTYTLEVQNAFGCLGWDSTEIIVLPLPNADAGKDTAVCLGTAAFLKGKGGLRYRWSPNSGMNCDTCQSTSVFPVINTVYTLEVTDPYGCQNEDSVTVSVLPLPPAQAGSDRMEICFGDTIHLSANGGIRYSWSPAYLIVNPLQSITAAYPDSSRWFYVEVEDANRCKASDSIFITVHGLPDAVPMDDDSICLGESIQLHATGGVSYSWSPGIYLDDSTVADPIATPNQSTVFTVWVQDAFSCQSSGEVSITVLPLPNVEAGNNGIICRGDTLRLSASGAASYTWLPSQDLDCANCMEPLWTAQTTTTFTVWGRDAFGCEREDTVRYEVLPLPMVSVNNDTVICPDQSVQLQASGGVSYLWQPPFYLDNAGISSPIATPADPIGYTVIVTDANGCSNSDSVQIDFYPGSNVVAGNDTAVCEGDSIRLLSLGADFYSWEPAQWLSDPSLASPIASPPSTQLFTVTGSSTNGCISADSILVTVYPRPVLSASPDSLFLCPGDSAMLTASGANHYRWYMDFGFLSDSTLPNIQIKPERGQILTLTGFSDQDCSTTLYIPIELAPVLYPNIQPKDTAVCLGDSISLSVLDGYSYTWMPAEDFINPFTAHAMAIPSGDTRYVVELIDSHQCVFRDTAWIRVLEPAIADAGPDASIYEGESIRLNGQGNGSFEWKPDKWLDNPQIPNPLSTPDSTIIYTLEVITSNGCMASDRVKIRVYLETQVWFANAFSPNGDGRNDWFGPEIYNEIEMDYFAVYNRWGLRLFYTETPGEKWDGMVNGAYAPAGTYVYEFKATGNRQKAFFKTGNFTLIR